MRITCELACASSRQSDPLRSPRQYRVATPASVIWSEGEQWLFTLILQVSGIEYSPGYAHLALGAGGAVRRKVGVALPLGPGVEPWVSRSRCMRSSYPTPGPRACQHGYSSEAPAQMGREKTWSSLLRAGSVPPMM